MFGNLKFQKSELKNHFLLLEQEQQENESLEKEFHRKHGQRYKILCKKLLLKFLEREQVALKCSQFPLCPYAEPFCPYFWVFNHELNFMFQDFRNFQVYSGG